MTKVKQPIPTTCPTLWNCTVSRNPRQEIPQEILLKQRDHLRERPRFRSRDTAATVARLGNET